MLEEYAKYYYYANFDTAITDTERASLNNRPIAHHLITDLLPSQAGQGHQVVACSNSMPRTITMQVLTLAALVQKKIKSLK